MNKIKPNTGPAPEGAYCINDGQVIPGASSGGHWYPSREIAEARLAQNREELETLRAHFAEGWRGDIRYVTSASANRAYKIAHNCQRGPWASGEVLAVRLHDSGDGERLLTVDRHETITQPGQKCPRLFNNRETCESFLNRSRRRIVESCDHDWEYISHEERRCKNCHGIQFVADYNNDQMNRDPNTWD